MIDDDDIMKVIISIMTCDMDGDRHGPTVVHMT